MDLMGDIVRDFVNRSHAELNLLARGLSEWRREPNDPEKLTFLAEVLQSLQELSGLLAYPELESLFQNGHRLLSTVRQRWPAPSLNVLAELQTLIKAGFLLLTELESRQTSDRLAKFSSSDVLLPPQTKLAQPSGPPAPAQPSEVLYEADNLSNFLIENLSDAAKNEVRDVNHMGARVARLIDEVMTERHQLREILAHAVTLTSKPEQLMFLDQECAACPELRSGLERLLTSESQVRRLLQFPSSELIRALLESLRLEGLQPLSEGLGVAMIVPDDEMFEPAVEATVKLQCDSVFLPTAVQGVTVDLVALPCPFGRYSLERELGRGAMGTVFLASDRLLNRQVALKLLRISPNDNPENVERFYREARSMASLQHANLCPIYDFGEVDGQPYLTMAFIDGQPLSDVLIGGRPLGTRYAVTLARTLAITLHQVHQMGIVHRDLKPANVMINKQCEPVLMDFGLARRQRPGEAEITQPGVILGSPAYMALEQVEGRIDKIGPRTDVYALGVILYQMLSGRKPFEGTVASILAQIHSKEASPLVVSDDPDGRLNAICRRAMAKDVSRRFVSALDMANELAEYLGDVDRVRLTPDVDLTPDAHTTVCDFGTDSTADTTRIWIRPVRKRPRWRWAAAVGLIVVAVVTVKLIAWNPSEFRPLKVGSTDTRRESH